MPEPFHLIVLNDQLVIAASGFRTSTSFYALKSDLTRAVSIQMPAELDDINGFEMSYDASARLIVTKTLVGEVVLIKLSL